MGFEREKVPTSKYGKKTSEEHFHFLHSNSMFIFPFKNSILESPSGFACEHVSGVKVLM